MGEEHSAPNDRLVEALTWREQDILHLLAERRTNREIAHSLGLELTTVKWYNKQIFSKLGVASRYQAVAKAQEYGLLDEPRGAPVAKGSPPKGSLPVQVTSFVGRGPEIGDVKRLLQEAHLLTLTGPAGTGKTRLATQAAAELLATDDFEDGVYFVDLAPIRQSERVADTIADALGIKEAAGQPISKRLKNYLGNKKSLLLLDNFEHVIEAAPLMVELLATAPELRILVTSREALNIYGEREYPVPPLALPSLGQPETLAVLSEYESVALFVQRARAVRPDFAITDDNAQAVTEVCVRLDGLPLAIELAAARVRMFGPQALLGQLEKRFTFLQGGPRGLPDRQRTLRGAIEWSYELLDDVEKTLFARLSVFQGGRTIEAVAAVCSHDLTIDVLDGLEALLNKSLLRREAGPAGEPRFTMLETLREYSTERLEGSGEAELIRKRHAEYHLTLAEQGDLGLRGPEHSLWLRRLETEHDNLRAALRWSVGGADAELGLRLAGALGRFWWVHGHHVRGRQWTERALAQGADAPPDVLARALNSAGFLGSYLGDLEQGTARNEEALALFRELGDKRNMAWALGFLAMARLLLGQLDECKRLYDEALALFREVNDRDGIAWVLLVLGEMARMQDDYARAEKLYNESLALYQEMGSNRFVGELLFNLGSVAYHQGDYKRMRALLEECLTTAWELGIRDLTANALVGLAGALGVHGQPDRAARLLGASEAHLEALGVEVVSSPADRPDYERYVADARAQLDEVVFEAAWAEGRAMRLKQAVAYALGQTTK
jgi:non-specific serine/threonine protein kinase